jgi:aryl-alcohol dehydrogenase-like predicted oxidoreductase
VHPRPVVQPGRQRPRPANQARLTERNLRIAREVDRVADELGATSAQVAVAWLPRRDRRVIPILGARKLEQFQDVLGSLESSMSGPCGSQVWDAGLVRRM